MDSVGQSQYSTPNWLSATQAVLPSQASQRIVIPAGAAQESNSSTRSTQTTRPGAAEYPKQSTEPARQSTRTDTVSSEQAAEQRQRELAVEQVLAQLRARDQEVRTHEQAHLSAAGQYAMGGIQYSYQTGPDGQKYAIGGSVGIDTSPVAGDSEATLHKARVLQRAALAPAQPSGQDMKVAAQASQMMMQAQVEIQLQRAETAQSDSEELDNQTDLAGAPTSLKAQQKSSRDSESSANLNVANAVSSDRNEFEIRISMQAQPADVFAIST
ncbi:MAG: hypothetical protein IBX48_02010 [Thiomicrospira sp.]|uniref:putative metalloprotease CJM1_0395 family protein n=1 Tax=Thiomicrospira sp. TaxID=935 RepID=UPI0019FCD1AE|nr:putative metalloprotease CJM1_0395 family protein [Thiomicrospira sp.]MBE0493094.1 hypothetical protein [Thiomicrospira sp.]